MTKVQIGLRYQPEWYELRDSNRTYMALNAPLDSDGLRVQRAMIGGSLPGVRVSSLVVWLMYTGAVITAVASAVVLSFK